MSPEHQRYPDLGWLHVSLHIVYIYDTIMGIAGLAPAELNNTDVTTVGVTQRPGCSDFVRMAQVVAIHRATIQSITLHLLSPVILERSHPNHPEP